MVDTNLSPSSETPPPPPPPPIPLPDQTENPPNGDTLPSVSVSSESEVRLETSDVMAKGVSSILGSVMRDFDSKAENTIKSQDQLSSSIDRLTGELDQLLEDAPLPFIMQHAAKISGVRKRVSSLNALLKSIQRRIDNIDRMLSTDSSHEKSTAEDDRKTQQQ